MNDGFEPVHESLRRQLRRRGLDKVTQAAFVCTVANQLSHGRFQAIRFMNQTLTLVVTDAVAAHELRPGLPRLGRELAQRLGWPAENKLRFQIRIQSGDIR